MSWSEMLQVMFPKENVDRAIREAQLNLQAFVHPVLGKVADAPTPNALIYIPGNFFATAGAAMPDHWVGYFDNAHYFCYLSQYSALVEACDASQREAIAAIVAEIIRQWRVFNNNDATKPYLAPLDKKNSWGKMTLGLAEAFGVSVGPEINS